MDLEPISLLFNIFFCDLSQLFGSLDTESSGYLDRHRMLHLLEKFWDKLEDEVKGTFHNPRKCKETFDNFMTLHDIYPSMDLV